jgi:cell division protein FtsW
VLFWLILSADRFGIGKKKEEKAPETKPGQDEENDNDLHNPANEIKESVDKLEDKVEFEIIQV